MAVVKTKRLVKFYEWNIKTITYVAVHDAPVSESVIIGPVRHFARRALVITNRDPSDSEVHQLMERVVKSDLECHRCRLSYDNHNYFMVDLKTGKAVCDNCDPKIRRALGAYEIFDIAFVETRGN